MIKSILKAHGEAFEKSFTDKNIQIMEQMAKSLVDAFLAGHKLLLCGNGGSAADAQHIAAEFVARFKLERKSLPALALTTDTSILTAWSNDYAFEKVFERQIEGLGQRGDILIAISTSGESKNVTGAVRKANEMGLKTFGFTGLKASTLSNMAGLTFLAGSTDTPHIQEMHITALHAISESVEHTLFSSST